MTAPGESLRVLVAGAAGEVGFHCSEAFSAQGAEVIMTDYDGVALTRAADRLGAFSIFCDAIGDTSLEIFAEELSALFPSINVLINAAGHGYVRPLAMSKMTRAMLPLLRRASGTRWIFNVGTVPRHDETETLFPYARSPSAFQALSRTFEEQLRGTSINVVTVLPDFDASGMTHSSRAHHARVHATEVSKRALAAVSAGRPHWKMTGPRQNRRA